LGGDGGFAEVSGKQDLIFNGTVDLRAPRGAMGTLLLDPEDLTIQATGPTTTTQTGSPTNTDTSNTDDSILTTGDLESQLALSNVLVQTGAGGTQNGDITIASPIAWNSANTLTLQAYRDLTVGAPISNSGIGGLNLVSGTGAWGHIFLQQPITMSGGDVNLTAHTGYIYNCACSVISTSGGSVTFNVDPGYTSFLGSDITTGGGAQTYNGATAVSNNITLNSGNGAITFNGTLDSSPSGPTGGTALTLQAGSGNVTFAGAVGGSDPLGSLLAIGGNITMDSPMTAANPGNAVVMVAGHSFVNNVGPNAINVPAGRFLIYSVDPSLDVFDGLTGASQYSTTYTGGPAPAFSGNGFLFSNADPPSLQYLVQRIPPWCVCSPILGTSNPATRAAASNHLQPGVLEVGFEACPMQTFVYRSEHPRIQETSEGWVPSYDSL
jgi:hypothetical protein